MADDLGEKTEEPTPKRRQESREEGNVSRSQDLAGAILLIAVTLTLWAASLPMLGQGKIVLERALGPEALIGNFSVESVRDFSYWIATAAIRMAMPLLLIGWLAGVVATLLQIGWLFTTKAIRPRASKLNPLKGFQRIFGLSGLVKVTLDSLKVLIVIVVATLTIMQYAERIVLLPYLTILQALSSTGWMMLDLALRVLAILLLLGILDFLYQRWRHHQDMKMTKQQVKDELKQTEGDPETRKRRSRLQQQIANQRIAAAVPNADVIVTNPEHISIAIKYDADAMNAPRVIAKGADFIALRIRQIAMQHGIPVVERKPLARALYRDVEVGREVPPQFYQAVAEILAYVYRLSGRKAG